MNPEEEKTLSRRGVERERTPLQEPPPPWRPRVQGAPSQDPRRVVGPKGESSGLSKGEEVLRGAKTLDTTMARRPQASGRPLPLPGRSTPPNRLSPRSCGPGASR